MRSDCTQRLNVLAAMLLGLSLPGVHYANASGADSELNELGVFGYRTGPILPWCGYRLHSADRPLPPFVDTTHFTPATSSPDDAIVLFDGRDTSHWEGGPWLIEEGALVAGEANLRTKEPFGDCQLHIEFLVPDVEPDHLLNRGNSGVFLMERYEVQIYDSHPSHEHQIYPDGQCAAIYGQTPPLVNASRKPGEWQTFDIVFTAPRFKGSELCEPASVTMLHNGVLVHLATPVHGPTDHGQIRAYEPHAAELRLILQGHGSPVRFRNIWIRRLDRLETECREGGPPW